MMIKQNAASLASAMRQKIRDGIYKTHDRLPSSRSLAEEFGVARNTLREALYRLSKEGLLETRPGSGTYVTAHVPVAERVPMAVEAATPLEIMDARFALEPHICRLCVLHGRREDFDNLDSLCKKMENSIDDSVAFAEADTAFHYSLVSSTRNNLLIWLIGNINEARSLDEWTRMRRLTLNTEMMRSYNAQHREILNALRAREPERAASRMKAHLEAARLSLTRAAEA